METIRAPSPLLRHNDTSPQIVSSVDHPWWRGDIQSGREEEERMEKKMEKAIFLFKNIAN
jgi:hypothetical protein